MAALGVYGVQTDKLSMQVDMNIGDDDSNDGEALVEIEEAAAKVYLTLDKVIKLCYRVLGDFLAHIKMYLMYVFLHPDKMEAAKRQFPSAISSFPCFI